MGQDKGRAETSGQGFVDISGTICHFAEAQPPDKTSKCAGEWNPEIQ